MRVGVDVGGTFTDFVFVHGDGHVAYHKVPSTPSDPSRAILQGLEAIRDTPIDALVHGSTVATNAVLERKGARTALIATRGFGDMLFIGRQVRPSLYDLFVQAPQPLVRPSDIVEVDERVDAAGSALTALSANEIEHVRQTVQDLQVESIAVILLFSYVNHSHETALARALEPLGVPVSVSSQVVAEYREYERASTTVVNAYVKPVMDRYIARLEAALPTKQFRIMQSNGGSMPPGEARRLPVHTILSGPAGGVAGASRVGEAIQLSRFVTFDMGGTSTDVALHDERVTVTSEACVEGFPLRVPMVDIHTVGAGGGSIAAFDAGGALAVGPESAGAVPGPACYGRGGERCAVTDANVVLGRLSAAHFLGGHMALDTDASRRAAERIARAGDVSVDDLAAGVVRVVNSNMERAIRVISVERGHDVRDFALLCFGGAGGLHAAELAAALDMPMVLVPRSPGTLSAYGVLNADVIKDLSRTVLGRETALMRVLAELEAEGRRVLAAEGVGTDITVSQAVDVRYRGQSFEIAVPYGEGMVEAFHARHERLFGHADREAPTEIVNARVRLVAVMRHVPLQRLPSSTARVEPIGTQRAWCGSADGWASAILIDRDALLSGQSFEGPAIVVEFTSTTWVPPRMRCEVDDYGNLRIHVGAPAYDKRAALASTGGATGFEEAAR